MFFNRTKAVRVLQKQAREIASGTKAFNSVAGILKSSQDGSLLAQFSAVGL
jgi:hypothetical protein